MSFNTLYFWSFFALFFLVYWTFLNRPGRLCYRNTALLIASYYFYASWDWRCLFVIFTSSIVSFYAAKSMSDSSAKRRKAWLAVCLAVNLGFLAAFKYNNFFIDSASIGLRSIGFDIDFAHLNWILPVGISFYTFQCLGYSIDVYRRKIEAVRDPIVFLSFVSFFPQLVAGPVERARKLVPQFQKTSEFDLAAAKQAIIRILWGLFKKMVIADRVAVIVNSGYEDPSALNEVTASLVIFLFAIQLYCDFSGYCDIAIGLARLMGFQLTENFKRPLISTSLQSLWKRWHVTIHTWFRDYIYCYLPRKRTGIWNPANILIMFGISGLWHGPTWNFVLWGVLNGVFLLTADPYVFRPLSRHSSALAKILASVLASALVYLSLVFFRGETWSQSIGVLSGLGSWSFPWTDPAEAKASILVLGLAGWEVAFAALFILLLLFVEILQETKHRLVENFFQGMGYKRWAAAFTLSITIFFFGFYDDRVGLVKLRTAPKDFDPNRDFQYQEF